MSNISTIYPFDFIVLNLQTPAFINVYTSWHAVNLRSFTSMTCRPRLPSKYPGLFTVHVVFGSVQMVMVSKNHGYKWLAVMVFTLSRLEHGWFRKNSVCYGPVYGS